MAKFPQKVKARNFHNPMVDVSKAEVEFTLSAKVRVPLHRFRDHLKDLEFEMEVGAVRPVEVHRAK